jgi:hypothetical protein
MNIDDWLVAYGDDLLLLEPRDLYDPCIVGVVERCGQAPHVLYDAEACIQALAGEDEWDHESAIEWFDFNTSGAWVGEHTPGFLWRCRDF